MCSESFAPLSQAPEPVVMDVLGKCRMLARMAGAVNAGRRGGCVHHPIAQTSGQKNYKNSAPTPT